MPPFVNQNFRHSSYFNNLNLSYFSPSVKNVLHNRLTPTKYLPTSWQPIKIYWHPDFKCSLMTYLKDNTANIVLIIKGYNFKGGQHLYHSYFAQWLYITFKSFHFWCCDDILTFTFRSYAFIAQDLHDVLLKQWLSSVTELKCSMFRN